MTDDQRAGSRKDMLYLEDHLAGEVFELGSIAVDEEQMIEFARQYDPQPFHIDRVAAEKTVFGGLVASGWYTASVAMRLIVDNRLLHVANLGSPGLDEVRWLEPVRPGDVLSVRLTIVETRRSHSKPDRGVVKSMVEIFNQNRDVVARWKGINIVQSKTGQPLNS